MARSRRPELEKDNPVAPQIYSRRNRTARGAREAVRLAADAGDTLHALAEAAEAFVNRTPRWKKTEAERQVLLDAITRAQLFLSVDHLPEADH
ncbi:MAG TPA: hypothetical protein VJ746_05495 [Nitrospira sp.]|nr:hypothetical protein [Nitrospira sp.]